MKKLGMKNLLLILLSALMNVFVWHDRNPAGVAFFCAAYAMIPGKMLLAVATLSGMAYALPMTAFIRYTGLIITVMAMAAVIRRMDKIRGKKKTNANLPPPVMYGLMVLTMLTAGIGYGMAYGPGWQEKLVQELPGALAEFGAATIVYWAAAACIAWMGGWRPAVRRKRPGINEEAMITRNQLHAFSESFRKLSESFEVDTSQRDSLNQQEMQDIFNAVTEQVCKDCSRCAYCWENVFEDSCETAYEILNLWH